MKQLLLVRHGESAANVTNDRQHPDPELSYLGILQCRALREHIRAHSPLAQQIELIVASPMRRALQTALYAFSWLVQAGVPIVARADWQEISDYPCDVGSDPTKLAADFPAVDFSTLDPVYPAKSGHYACTKAAIAQRGYEAKMWLCRRPERVIAVVSHDTFLRTSIASSHFANADYRTYDLSESPTGSSMIEWTLSAKHGGAMGRSPRGRAATRGADFVSVA